LSDSWEWSFFCQVFCVWILHGCDCLEVRVCGRLGRRMWSCGLLTLRMEGQFLNGRSQMVVDFHTMPLTAQSVSQDGLVDIIHQFTTHSSMSSSGCHHRLHLRLDCQNWKDVVFCCRCILSNSTVFPSSRFYMIILMALLVVPHACGLAGPGSQRYLWWVELSWLELWTGTGRPFWLNYPTPPWSDFELSLRCMAMIGALPDDKKSRNQTAQHNT
jgi:hypothetical protein